MGRKSREQQIAEHKLLVEKVIDYLLTHYNLDITSPMDYLCKLRLSSILEFGSRNKSVEDLSKQIFNSYTKYYKEKQINEKLTKCYSKPTFTFSLKKLESDIEFGVIQCFDVLGEKIKMTKEELKGLADFIYNYLENN
jgi:hypothetical protein